MTDRKPKDSKETAGHSSDPGASSAGAGALQGEGDYVSGRRYQQDAAEFVQQHDTGRLARDAAPKNDAEAREMLEAEREGQAKAKGRKPGNIPSNR
jgi:hypothetical protein